MPTMPNPDDIIKQPDAAAYIPKVRRTRPDATGITNYGLAKLVELEEALDSQAAQMQYQDELSRGNEQRSVLAEMARRQQAELDRREQDLDFGASARDDIALGPLLEQYGVPYDPAIQGELDRAKPQSVLAKIAKDRASAHKDRTGGGMSKIKTKYDAVAGPGYEVTGPLTDDVLSQLPPDVAEAMQSGKGGTPLTGDRGNSAGGTSFRDRAAKASAPTAMKVKGQSVPITNATDRGDGTFAVPVFDAKSGRNRTAIIDSEGRLIGAED